jgi:hypothetical protein
MNRTLKIAAIAAALLVAVSFSAMAVVSTPSNPGRNVVIAQEIKDFFAARGANPAYLGLAKSAVPAAEWTKIEAVLNVADDTTVTTDDHDVLNTMVMEALMLATTTTDDPVYMDLGDHRWIYEQDTADD